jgi:hypothetical protein
MAISVPRNVSIPIRDVFRDVTGTIEDVSRDVFGGA